MKIIRSTVAGTLESSDIQIRIEPSTEEQVTVHLESVVMKQFGHQIRSLIEEELSRLGVTGCSVYAVDKGALDFAIVARLQSAVYQSAEMIGDVSWEVVG